MAPRLSGRVVKKRKFGDEDDEEQNGDDSATKRLALTAKVLCSSSGDTIEIFVGKDKESYTIHRNLIALHSQYFANYFRSGNWNEDDCKFELPQFNPAVFADFYAWLYSGENLQIGQILSTANYSEERWALGKYLQAPGFQNFAMESILDECQDEPNHFLYVSDIEATYKLSKKGDLLRKLAADRIDCENPMPNLSEGSKERKEWEDLIVRCSELASDIFIGSRNWNGKYPWSAAHRQRYMEKEVDLEELWQRQILQRRTRDEIKRAATSNCMRSIIELAHIDRKK